MTLSIGRLELGEIPRIAVPLLDDDPRGDVEAIRDLADIIELRIDGFSNLEPEHVRGVIGEVREASAGSLPLIATIRAADEGGIAAVPEDVRSKLFGAILPLVDAVDIELNSGLCDRILEEAAAQRRTTIVSYHDFKGTPPAIVLEETLARCRTSGADLFKIATSAHTLADVRTLLEFTLRHRQHELITIALGEVGGLSRVFFPTAGSRITYGWHRLLSAPGQLPLRELHAELRRYYPAFDADARRRGHGG